MFTGSKCCIIGIPDHMGVIHVGGRVGAARGPACFRQQFSQFKGKVDLKKIITLNEDVPGLGSDIDHNHKAAIDFITQNHQNTGLSVIIGGGHDHGYTHLQAVFNVLRKKNPKARLGCINIDAHLDVRKPTHEITSGSPFYLALEAGILDPSRFVEFGIQSHCNASELWDYIDDKGVRVVPFQSLRGGKATQTFQKELKKLAGRCDSVVISLDLDAAAAAFAPGVSAPQAEGFTSMELIEFCETAGKEKKVHSLGIFELNPEHDQDDRTSRLAATTAYHFIEAKNR